MEAAPGVAGAAEAAAAPSPPLGGADPAPPVMDEQSAGAATEADGGVHGVGSANRIVVDAFLLRWSGSDECCGTRVVSQ